MDYVDVGEACFAEAGLEGCGQLFGGYGDDSGAPAEALGEGNLEVLARGESDGLIAIGEGFADGEGRVADGAGGAEDC